VSAGLEQGVVDALRTWEFEPATVKGKPLAATVEVQVSFSFNSL
jgi:outer membrane biosynthesis protein TonB